MKPYWSKVYGNPGALHWFGQQASAAVFKARQSIAQSLGCHYSEIVFTGSATEANNLAIRGVIHNRSIYGGSTSIVHIVTTAIEHASVLEPIRALEKAGVIEVIRFFFLA